MKTPLARSHHARARKKNAHARANSSREQDSYFERDFYNAIIVKARLNLAKDK